MKDMDLKTTLFVKASTALTAYQAALATKYPAPEAEKWHDRFCALYEVITAAGLEDEYQRWVED